MKNLKINFIAGGMGGAGGGGGIGQMASGIVKSVVGIGQLIKGGIDNKKADSMMPAETDPSQTSMLDTFRRLRKGYQTGSEAASYRDTINTGLSAITSKAAAYSGGNTGQLLATLTGAQSNADTAYNQMAGGMEKNRLAALTMEDQQTDEIAQRRLDIQMAKYLQKKAEGTSAIKAGGQNWMAGGEEFGAGAQSMWGGGGAGGGGGASGGGMSMPG